jgi:hypothetical protein
MRTFAAIVLLAVLGGSPQDYPKASPFAGLRWVEGEPDVRVDGAWYRLVSINGTPAKDILDFCKSTWGKDWQRRFGEDLVEVLVRMKLKPRVTVDLEVKELDSGKVREIKGVRMTRQNREAVRNPLTGDQIGEDLEQLRAHLEDRYSYLTLRPWDWGKELDAMKARLAKEPSRQALALDLMRFLSRFGDGHSSLDEDPLPPGYAPYLLGDAGGQLVAFHPHRRDFLDPTHPYVRSIDGLPLAKWLDAASRVVPAGSPAFVRNQGIRMLRNVTFLRGELGLKADGPLILELETEDRTDVISKEQNVQGMRPTYGTWPSEREPNLRPDVGYLRIEDMVEEQRYLKELARRMEDFRNTEGLIGLIIDVRGNGGGTRDVLRTLFPYFMTPGDGLHIANVAVYRRPAEEAENRPGGYLKDRELHPVTSDVWTAEDRAAIETFAKSFKPEWAPPPDKFTAWHYFALKPGAAPFTFDKPVVILMDSQCFSATDIFLGAFKGWRNVTLMGAPSGGGSGRVRQLNLKHSKIALKLSTIASFRRDGSLYDGRGVPPDVELAPKATDFLQEKGDSVLEAAVERLKKK